MAGTVRAVLTAGGLALLLAVTSFVASLVAVAVALQTDALAAGIFARGALVLVVVALATAVTSRRLRHRAGLPATALTVAGAGLGLLLSPPLWSGRLGLGQLVAAPGVVTVLVDVVCWAGAVVVGLALAGRGARSADRPAARSGA